MMKRRSFVIIAVFVAIWGLGRAGAVSAREADREFAAGSSAFGATQTALVQTPAKIEISLSSDPSDAASFIKDSIHVSDLYDGISGKQLHAHVFDQDGALIQDVVCNSVTWNVSISGGGIPAVPFADLTGCSMTLPHPVGEAVVTAIKATYAYRSADRESISKSITVYNGPTYILLKNASLSKHNCATTVKPHAVTFTAVGSEITALTIYNIQGKRIFATSGNHREITWNRANSPRGLYVFKTTMNNGAIIQRSLILK
jgi:hypothetical protein